MTFKKGKEHLNFGKKHSKATIAKMAQKRTEFWKKWKRTHIPITCTAPNCKSIATRVQLCSKHYYQIRRHGNFDPLEFICECHKRIFKSRTNLNAHLANLGQNNGQWKGDFVGKNQLHRWVRSRLPEPKFCQRCKKQPPYDLANKFGNYVRDLSEWEYLCRKCHMESDNRLIKLHKSRDKKR